MAYRVKTSEGELNFASLYDIERAYAQGLVDEDDDVLEEGATAWRKVGAIPALRQARPAPAPRWAAWLPWVVASLLFGGWALFELFRGYSLRALVLALIAGALGSGLTYKAFKK